MPSSSSNTHIFADIYKACKGKNAALIKAVKKLDSMVGCEDLKFQVAQFVKYLSVSTMSHPFKKKLRRKTLMKRKVSEEIVRDRKRKRLEKMYIKSQTTDDLIAGKLLLFLLDVLDTRLKSMSKGSGIFNK